MLRKKLFLSLCCLGLMSSLNGADITASITMLLFEEEDETSFTLNTETSFPIGTIGVMGDYRHADPIVGDHFQRAEDNSTMLAEFTNMKTEGFNTVYSSWTADTNYETAFAEMSISVAEATGMKIIPAMQNTMWFIKNNGDSTLDSADIHIKLIQDAIDTYKNSDFVIGYVTYDEPSHLQSFLIQNVGAANTIIKNLHPESSGFSALNSHAIKISEIDIPMNSDVLIIDPYPFANNQGNNNMGDKAYGDLSDAMPRGWIDADGTVRFNGGEDQLPYCEHIENAMAAVGNKPTWVIVQAHTDNWALRKPIPKELRLQVFLSLASGAKGIFYFQYQDESNGDGNSGLRDSNNNPTDLLYEAIDINKEVTHLGDLLLELEREVDISVTANYGSTNVFGMPTAKVEAFKHPADGRMYIFCVNTDVQNTQNVYIEADISTLANQSSLQVVDLYTNETFSYTIENNTLKMTVPMDAGDGRLLYLKVQ